MQQAMEDALFDVFINGTAKIEEWMKKTSCDIQIKLTFLVENGTLEEICKRSFSC